MGTSSSLCQAVVEEAGALAARDTSLQNEADTMEAGEKERKKKNLMLNDIGKPLNSFDINSCVF